jgi:hypothetical protein
LVQILALNPSPEAAVSAFPSAASFHLEEEATGEATKEANKQSSTVVSTA